LIDRTQRLAHEDGGRDHGAWRCAALNDQVGTGAQDERLHADAEILADGLDQS
jgi:hypothetical protein